MIASYLIHYPWLVDLLCLVVIPLLFILVGYLWRRRALRRHRTSRVFFPVMILLAVLFASGYLYGKFIGSRQLEVRRVELSFSTVPEAFDGYRIVQLSDIHAGSMDSMFLRRIVDSVNACHPDLIVITGDMQNAEPYELEPLLPTLKRLKAPDGICSVLGNHDYGHYSFADEREKINNLGRIMTYQQDMDWYMMTNSRRFIRRGDQRIVIAGMENDGEGRFPQLGDIQASLYGANRNDFVVMLEHDPTAWRRKILRHCHAQLTLSGHTHGGQVALFGWSLASLHYRECYGVYWMGDRCINVTRGVNGAIPVRIGATPEIVVITLKKK